MQTQTAILPRELYRQQRAGTPVELLDVRTPPEYGRARVTGARLIPLAELDPETFLNQRRITDAPLYITCQSGTRAAAAVEKFRRAGFNGCILVEGGMEAWMNAGLPVERGETKVLPLMRQVQIVVGAISAVGAAMALWVNIWFAVIPLMTGCGLLFAGMTGTCGMALLLARLPWNRSRSCDAGSCCS